MLKKKRKPRMSSVMGRPSIPIDWEKFDKLCFIQCTLEEIAGFFDCSVDTIERAVKDEKRCTFADYHKTKAAGGKASLRRRLYSIAHSENKGNVAVAIWLSKQYLGMKERIEETYDDVQPFIIETSKGTTTLGIKKARRHGKDD